MHRAGLRHRGCHVAANYGISLFVLAASLGVRAKASMIKGASMAAFGVWVVGHALYQATTGHVPEPVVQDLATSRLVHGAVPHTHSATVQA